MRLGLWKARPGENFCSGLYTAEAEFAREVPPTAVFYVHTFGCCAGPSLDGGRNALCMQIARVHILQRVKSQICHVAIAFLNVCRGQSLMELKATSPAALSSSLKSHRPRESKFVFPSKSSSDYYLEGEVNPKEEKSLRE